MLFRQKLAKMTQLVTLLFALLLPTSTFATIIVVHFTDDWIIVAAESRAFSMPANTIDDHACKITQLDSETLFFVWGPAAAGFDPIAKRTTWSAGDLSKTAFAAANNPHDRHRLCSNHSNLGRPNDR